MHPADASEFLDCPECREVYRVRTGNESERIRTISRKHAEEHGRPQDRRWGGGVDPDHETSKGHAGGLGAWAKGTPVCE